ncbi:MAG: hypothetical protein FJZ75_10105 [Bacteroidetes bacterium]|nr:hypothetical protein [Bacteroidota bacterium]
MKMYVFWGNLLCLAFGFCVGLKAQTLQFSQVKLVTTIETVPANKVWKIESALSGEHRLPTSGTSFPTLSRFIKINGTDVCVQEYHTAGLGLGFNGCCGGGFWMNNTGQSPNSTQTHLVAVQGEPSKLPIWLPAGSTLETSTRTLSISVIEFNIVP